MAKSPSTIRLSADLKLGVNDHYISETVPNEGNATGMTISSIESEDKQSGEITGSSPLLLPSSRAEPYDALAMIYDRMMTHVDYGHWSRFIIELLMRHRLPEGDTAQLRVLEAACGTGTLALSLAGLALKVDAFDRSAAMIKEALRKSETTQNAPHFFVGTFDNFQANPPYDAAICLYDSINYLLEAKQVTRFLRQIAGALKPGGIFLFDICTELNSILHFNGRREREEGPGYRYQRVMRYKHANRIQENIFEIVYAGPPRRTITEHHRQKIYSLDEMRGFIASAGLTLVEELDGYEIKRPTSRSLRVHFVARKPLE